MMKSFLYLLPLLGAFVLADETCQCPLVKCPADDAVKLCNCLNSRETMCKNHCPDYVPTYRPCPISPTNIPTPTPTSIPTATSTATQKPSCVCANKACPMIWPLSCYCANDIKKACYDKCGGPEPAYATCPSLPTLLTLGTPTTPTPTPTKPTTPNPTATHAICGGGRANYRPCSDGYTCIKEPGSTGCGPECDGLGICVREKMCGGFAAFGCEVEGQVCVDDPRDACDPKTGGADCGGLCVFEGYVHDDDDDE
ncbi:hypothetical protein BDV96DRAFT_201537 [Lophiotrema nucula]|uniref:Uncharacterized protein n=1 Tax=Lophiotrema nucula TaxID=690887 RepID=A0A6A5YWC3_9PLEO|nr:hypothetical protein BDV96DRAFT_201537 [Lophiotrema nucula]